MLQEMYPEFVIDKSEFEPGFDLTLRIDTSEKLKTNKVDKSLSEEDQQKIRDQNEQIRQQRQEKNDLITTRMAKLRRDFLGAPVRKAIMATKAG